MAKYFYERFLLNTKFYFTFLICILKLVECTTNINDMPCSNVKYAYTAKGFDDGDVPSAAIPGEHLRICERGLTCCTKEMEHKLSTHSRAEFDHLLQSTIAELRNVFDSQTSRFDEFFKELLKLSKKGFHEMFVRTYGTLYETNAYIFNNMFDDLEKYYLTGGVDLADALDGFFHRLYRKMFQVLNGQYTFGDSYLNCISEFMDELKPFGDVPHKLIIEVKRSFTATRTFVQALAVGRDVVKNAMDVGPTPECSRALMKMTYCPHCHGLPDLKPCALYCLNVMTDCLAYHADLNLEWNNYIDSLTMLATRLESSFNVESVLEPINIKISEAIMNFQENGNAVSERLFEKCGKPRLGKRNVKHELKQETLRFTYQHMVRPTTAAGTSVDRLVQNIKKKMKKAKKFWLQLPEQICAHPQIADEPRRDDCWNGAGKIRNLVNVSSGHSGRHEEMSKFGTENNRQNSIINQQILTLKLITSKLSNAYNGQDVEWEDSSDLSSGSGSGSGYGGYEVDSVPDGYGDIYFSIPSSTERAPPPPPVTPTISAASELLPSMWITLVVTLLYKYC